MFFQNHPSTTGLPKAAKIFHGKFFATGYGFIIFLGIHLNRPNGAERFYTPLPFYHTSACLIANATALVNGFSIVTRRKFSASNFFKDVTLHDCSISQYIGETCRYLLNTKVTEYDKKHKLRVLIGNGLRAEVWKEFQEKYNIPLIAEFYGATESPLAFLNTENVVGACGVLPPLFKKLHQPLFVKYDIENEQVIRVTFF